MSDFVFPRPVLGKTRSHFYEFKVLSRLLSKVGQAIFNILLNRRFLSVRKKSSLTPCYLVFVFPPILRRTIHIVFRFVYYSFKLWLLFIKELKSN